MRLADHRCLTTNNTISIAKQVRAMMMMMKVRRRLRSCSKWWSVWQCQASFAGRKRADCECHNQLSVSSYLFSVCRHAKLEGKLDPEAARSCANLRTEVAAAPAAAKPAGHGFSVNCLARHLEAWMRCDHLKIVLLSLLGLFASETLFLLFVRHSLSAAAHAYVCLIMKSPFSGSAIPALKASRQADTDRQANLSSSGEFGQWQTS